MVEPSEPVSIAAPLAVIVNSELSTIPVRVINIGSGTRTIVAPADLYEILPVQPTRLTVIVPVVSAKYKVESF